MGYKIEEIEGIGPSYGEKLRAAGIDSTDDLLEKGATAAGRTKIADETDISTKLILTWANMSDLMRIKGVGPEYAELLEAAGIDTVKELRHRNAGNLATAMATKNEEKSLTRTVPSEKVVQGWVDQAKDMEPRISH